VLATELFFSPATSFRFIFVPYPKHTLTEKWLGVARNDSPGFRMEERTVGRKKESSTIPPCEEAIQPLLNGDVPVNRKFSKKRKVTRKQKDIGVLGQNNSGVREGFRAYSS
jgi:hypothetical protein